MDISIVIPVYNAENYLQDTLTSLEEQTDRDFKVIIINDGSTDKSDAIIHQFIRRGIINISYYEQSNQGVSSARNKALLLADTKFIMFCDADDKYHPKMVETMHKMMLCEADVAVCGVAHKESELYTNYSAAITQLSMSKLMHLFLYKNNQFNFPCFCYKTEIIHNYKLVFSLDLKYGEDEEFTWKYLLHCNNANMTKEKLYYYRYNQLSATKNITMARTQVIDSMIRVVGYYKERNSPFAKELESYGLPRTKLAILTEFAKNNRLDLFQKLSSTETYNYKIIHSAASPDPKIKIAAFVYSLSPTLFYNLVKTIL